MPPVDPELGYLEIAGVDGKTYKIEKEGQILVLHEINAKPLIDRGYAIVLHDYTKELEEKREKRAVQKLTEEEKKIWGKIREELKKPEWQKGVTTAKVAELVGEDESVVARILEKLEEDMVVSYTDAREDEMLAAYRDLEDPRFWFLGSSGLTSMSKRMNI